MLKPRLLTALTLIPIVFLIIYYMQSWVFISILSILIAICGWEWLQLIPMQTWFEKISFLVGLMILVLLIFQVQVDDRWLLIATSPWLLIIWFIGYFPKSQLLWGSRVIVISFALYSLLLFSISMLSLYHYQNGRTLVMCLLLLVWAADIGAYMTGKIWGVSKFIPAVSPGKTVAGICGGAGCTLLVACGIFLYFNSLSWMAWLIIGVSGFIMAVIGDLFISMLKRRVNIKDTSVILPGHGGLLDRLDSLIAVTPIFYLQYSWFNQG